MKTINHIFANTLKIDGNKNLFEKVFLLYVIIEKMINVHREIRAKMMHDNEKKTIYYDNAIIKVYNIRILFT